MTTKLMLGDNLKSLKELPDNSVDSVVTDPPYALTSIKKRFGKEGSAPAQYGTDGAFQRASRGFMGKEWDAEVPTIEFWSEVYRVLKPGGHVLSFGGTRTYHRMVVNIEDAGFEIRDQIMWLYGSGFPKSHNIGKAVDKIEGNEREVIGTKNDFALDGRVRKPDIHKPMSETINSDQEYGYKQGWDTPVTKGQSEYEGWGTALKPANEPICVARKPISEKTIAENVMKWGTGGINIDGCRIEGGSRTVPVHSDDVKEDNTLFGLHPTIQHERVETTEGRFPANVMLDEEAAELLDKQSGVSKSTKAFMFVPDITGGSYVGYKGATDKKTERGHNDSGGASRFFYVAKVSKKERNLGLDGFEEKESVLPGLNTFDNDGNRLRADGSIIPPLVSKNIHPTVKPVKLMNYLCRLITPPNGVVLDPFMGSGSTGIAAQLEGFNFIGMEMDEEYMKIAEARINNYEEYRQFIK